MISFVFLVFVVLFCAAVLTMLAHFVLHFQVFSKVFGLVHRELDRQLSAMPSRPESPADAEAPPVHVRCDHCGSTVARAATCPHCGASLG